MTDKQAFWKRVEFASDKPLGVIADSCGIKRSRMYSLKSRGLYPNAIECLALSTALGTSIQYLLTGEVRTLRVENLTATGKHLHTALSARRLTATC